MHYRIFIGMAVLVTAIAIGLVWGDSERNAPRSPEGESARKTLAKAHGRAPDFELKDLEGKTVRLSDFAGQVRIVDFWATWCLPCRQEIPHFQSLYETYRKKGVTIIGISLDQGGSDVVKSFSREYKMTYPTVMGNVETARAFGDVRAIPTTFVIDREGMIFKKYVGYKEREVFEQDILTLLNENP
jgi:peroxiredoxin